MNAEKNNNNIGIIIGVVLVLVVLFFIFGGGGKKGGGGGGAPPSAPPPSDTSVCPTSPTLPEESAGGCPLYGNYNYCSSDKIDKIYIVESCSASKRLVTKLINEGKLTGEDDPNIIRCCKNPELCSGIRKYPSVTCKADPLLIYEGYCP